MKKERRLHLCHGSERQSTCLVVQGPCPFSSPPTHYPPPPHLFRISLLLLSLLHNWVSKSCLFVVTYWAPTTNRWHVFAICRPRDTRIPWQNILNLLPILKLGHSLCHRLAGGRRFESGATTTTIQTKSKKEQLLVFILLWKCLEERLGKNNSA